MTTLADLTMSQLATAFEALSGIPTSAKSWNTKSRAVARLEALLAEKGLNVDAALNAAGIEQPAADPVSLDLDVAIAEVPFAAPLDDENDRPRDAAELLASETLASECRAILTKYMTDVGLNADIAEAAADRAIKALPLPAPSRSRGTAGRREGGKLQAMIDMMRAPEGVTVSELATALGWAPNSVRGAISGTLRKKFGLDVISAKTPGENRVYRVEG